ncbi:MAG: ComF family protein [Smithellaceae bacterium]
MIINEVLRHISDIIFPPQCISCAAILQPLKEKGFCSPCREKVKFLTGSLCPICGMMFFDSPAASHLCGNCLENKPYFSSARAVASYETIILNAIHQFKYGRNLSIGALLASFMADFSFPDLEFKDYSLIIPVPLHIKKLRKRGFNQAIILAAAIGKKWQIPVNFSLLKRCKFTLSQTGLDKKERERNIKRAFEVTDRAKVAGRNIILVDDVYTTGATLNECAKILTKAEAQKVAVLTLARVLQDSII